MTETQNETSRQSEGVRETVDNLEYHLFARELREEDQGDDEDIVGAFLKYNDDKNDDGDDDDDNDKNDESRHTEVQGLPLERPEEDIADPKNEEEMPMEEDVEEIPDHLGGEEEEESPLLSLPMEIWSKIWRDLYWDTDPTFTVNSELYGDERELIDNMRTWGHIFAALVGNDSMMTRALITYLDTLRWFGWGVLELGAQNGINLQALGGRFPLVRALFTLKRDYHLHLKDHQALQVLAHAIVLKWQGVEAGHGFAHSMRQCVRDDAYGCGYNPTTLRWYVADHWAAHWPEGWNDGTILNGDWTSRPITEEDDVWEYEIVGAEGNGLPQLARPGVMQYVRGC